eukprot:5811625-Ditylum_brightwellii.AAC.1
MKYIGSVYRWEHFLQPSAAQRKRRGNEGKGGGGEATQAHKGNENGTLADGCAGQAQQHRAVGGRVQRQSEASLRPHPPESAVSL